MPHFIFIQHISVLNILNMLYNLHFFSSECRLFHNATLFGFCITHILNTGCAKILRKSVAESLSWYNLLFGLCQLFNIPKNKELFGHRRLPLCVLRWKGEEANYPPESHRRENPPPSLSKREIILHLLTFVCGLRNVWILTKQVLYIFRLLFHITVCFCIMLRSRFMGMQKHRA
jgi:hypothetical protein